MEITNTPPRSFQFIKEHGQILKQGVEYEWLPTKCKSCSGFGHSMVDCHKEKKTIWVKKEASSKAEVPMEQSKVFIGLNEEELGEQAGVSEVVDHTDSIISAAAFSGEDNSGQIRESSKDEVWQTPRRVAIQSRQGPFTGGTSNQAVQTQSRLINLLFFRNRYMVVRLGFLEVVFLMDKCNILSWNLRGLNSINKQISVQDVCRRNKIGIGGLLETKMRGNKIGEFMEHKLPNWEFYSSPKIEGRLLIIWRKGIVRMSVLEESPQTVHCQVNLVGQRGMFYVTFVYGYNVLENRRSLWHDLTRISLLVKAWIVLGDFNAPFSGLDRSGGKPIAGVELTDPVGWLVEAKMEAMKSSGSYFTWTNNQDGSARIYSKIDHVFMNEDWLDMFPQSLVVFSWEVVSDHCSCVVSNIPMEAMGIKLFRFFNFWTGHSSFKQVVLSSWRVPIRASGLRAIYLRLVRLKHRLKKFNRDYIGDVGCNYQSAMGAYQDAQFQAQVNPFDIRLQ
ncbi:uncharacterized protein LOC133805796 [Humulus lupulus]|uniref:uncharacterized protein LOC133805796 n=1 Tax=Humulus lupulus TaxID=3486 RepID=UPI002B40F4A6|nr:uncharacterized protein LOC133805796 [Humulus lupulus]